MGYFFVFNNYFFKYIYLSFIFLMIYLSMFFASKDFSLFLIKLWNIYGDASFIDNSCFLLISIRIIYTMQVDYLWICNLQYNLYFLDIKLKIFLKKFNTFLIFLLYEQFLWVYQKCMRILQWFALVSYSQQFTWFFLS